MSAEQTAKTTQIRIRRDDLEWINTTRKALTARDGIHRSQGDMIHVALLRLRELEANQDQL